MTHFLCQNGPKMTPKWLQDGPKMAPRWPLGGSWSHLGGKMAPRWSQEGFKVEKVNSFPPCWGPSWGQVGPCWAPSWLTMALEHHSKNLVVKKSCGPKMARQVHGMSPPWGPLNQSTRGPRDPLTLGPRYNWNLALHCA